MAQKLGLKEIAEASGVSMSTVSRALSGDKRVNERTRRKVRAAAEVLQLNGSHGSGANVQQDNQCLALIQPVHNGQIGDTEVSIRVLECLQDFGEQHNMTIVTGRLRSDRRGLAALGLNANLQVAGVIGFRMHDADIQTFVQATKEAHVPRVVLNRVEQDATVPVCSVDHRKAGELAARHLVELGHKRIGIIFDATRVQSSQLRLEGVQQTLQDAGTPLASSLVRTDASDPLAARDVAVELVRQGATALIVCNDRQGLAVQGHLIAQGYAVPNDVSVVAFDGTDAAAMASPALTSVYTPWREMTRAAAQLIQMLDRDALLTQAKLVWQPKLLMGGSCAAPKTEM